MSCSALPSVGVVMLEYKSSSTALLCNRAAEQTKSSYKGLAGR